MSNIDVFVVHEKKGEPYSVMDNAQVRNKNLSWGATGMYAYLCTNKSDWKIYVSDLKNRKTNGESSTAGFMRELEENGYIYRERVHGEKGRFSHFVTHFYKDPADNEHFNPNKKVEPKEKKAKPQEIEAQRKETKTLEAQDENIDRKLLNIQSAIGKSYAMSKRTITLLTKSDNARTLERMHQLAGKSEHKSFLKAFIEYVNKRAKLPSNDEVNYLVEVLKTYEPKPLCMAIKKLDKSQKLHESRDELEREMKSYIEETKQKYQGKAGFTPKPKFESTVSQDDFE